jgi:nitrite reductase/ring-hydroxylating ferredoxin subunit
MSGQKSDGHGSRLERLKIGRTWYLIVHEPDGVARAFVDNCSHKDIPLGPKVALRKGCIRCPHHGVCFDPETGAVVERNGKKVPEGLTPVPAARAADGTLVLLAGNAADEKRPPKTKPSEPKRKNKKKKKD